MKTTLTENNINDFASLLNFIKAANEHLTAADKSEISRLSNVSQPTLNSYVYATQGAIKIETAKKIKGAVINVLWCKLEKINNLLKQQ
jgi:hypothetical protein